MEEVIKLLEVPEVFGTVVGLGVLLVAYIWNRVTKKELDEDGKKVARGAVSRLFRFVLSKMKKKK